MQLAHQHYRGSCEPPLFGGWIPFLGHAVEFGTDYRKLLQRLASVSGSSPAFTVYVAGTRMTFIKSALDFPSVLKQSKRLDFHTFGFEVSKKVVGIQCAHTDDSFQRFNHTMPKQWRMLKGDHLEVMMHQIKPALIQALSEKERAASGNAHSWQAEEDLNELVSRLVWQTTANSLFGDLIAKPLSGDQKDAVGALERARQAFLRFDDKFALLAGVGLGLGGLELGLGLGLELGIGLGLGFGLGLAQG